MADEQDPKQSREEFAEARRALVDRIVKDHPGLSHTDFNDVKIADFDTHATTLATQRTAADLEAGARALGITVEEFTALKKPAEAESTPQSRSASLPAGKAPQVTPTATVASEGGLTGIDLIEAAAAEDYAHLFKR